MSNLATSCIGCRLNEPNQLAHMEIGGCLYQSNNCIIKQSDNDYEISDDNEDTNKNDMITKQIHELLKSCTIQELTHIVIYIHKIKK